MVKKEQVNLVGLNEHEVLVDDLSSHEAISNLLSILREKSLNNIIIKELSMPIFQR